MITIALICALPQESRPLRRAFVVTTSRPFAGLPCWETAWGGKRIIVVTGGIGPDRARAATMSTIDAYSPDMIISTGFCGALSSGTARGDLVIAERLFLLSPDGSACELPQPVLLPTPETMATGHTSLRGDFITTPAILAKEQVRPILPPGTHHPVLEMESAAVAITCNKHGVPVGGVRSVSDPADEDPSDLFRAIATTDLRVSPLSTARAILKQPAIVPRLAHLAASAGHAGRTLATGIRSLTEKL